MNSKSSSNSQRIIVARTEARLAELTAELLETSPGRVQPDARRKNR